MLRVFFSRHYLSRFSLHPKRRIIVVTDVEHINVVLNCILNVRLNLFDDLKRIRSDEIVASTRRNNVYYTFFLAEHRTVISAFSLDDVSHSFFILLFRLLFHRKRQAHCIYTSSTVLTLLPNFDIL